MMKIKPKEIESVLKLDAFARYTYAMKRIADSLVVYYLIDEMGNFALSEMEGKILFSIWSAEEYAQLNKVNEWSEYSVIEMNLDQFLNETIPLLRSKKYLLSIFAANSLTGFVVEIDEFIRDLDAELEHYE